MKLNLFHPSSWTFWPERDAAIAGNAGRELSYRWYALFLFVFTALVNLIFINNDLWQDELYTLDEFVLVPMSKTLTDYHTTNNHIVFNLISNFYCRVIGVNDLRELLQQPWLIRLVPYFFTLLTIPLLYSTVKKIQGSYTAIVTLVIYASSLLVYTFGVQVRGYSLEFFLCILFIRFVLEFRVKPKAATFAGIVIAGFLLLLNLPSTIYFFAAIMLVVFLGIIFPLRAFSVKKALFSAPGKILITLIISFCLFALFFWFKKDQLSSNELLTRKVNTPVELLKQPFVIALRLLDWRYFLVLPLLLAFISTLRFRLSLFFVLSLVLPFLLFTLHNPTIVQRIWIVMLPVFCWLLAQLWVPVLQMKKPFLLLFTTLCIVTALFSLWRLQYESEASNRAGKRPLDLRRQYHLFGFHPNKVMEKAKIYAASNSSVVFLYDETLSGIQYYLDRSGLDTVASPASTSRAIFLLTDHIQARHLTGLSQATVIDSGKNNATELYKWYLLKGRPE